MGYALAKEAYQLGAHVILISGPTSLDTPLGVEFYNVFTAQEMYTKVMENFAEVDIAISAAAVADFKPQNFETQKIKKKEHIHLLKLEKTKDILAKMGELKQNQFLVGFALETIDETNNAIKKIKS